MNVKELAKENLAKRICGEITLSEKPGIILRKWRNIFKISQKEIADDMGIMPSVISDYESGRRKSPGINIIKRIVESLLRVSEKKGNGVLKEFYTFREEDLLSSSLMDIKEFKLPVSVKNFCKEMECDVVAREDLLNNEIYGYSVVDSLKAIQELSPMELVKIYGLTTNRALVFTKVSTGRSTMVAIKVTNLKPSLIIFHGIEKIDEVAKRIAEIEGIVLAVSKTDDVEDLIKKLRRRYK